MDASISPCSKELELVYEFVWDIGSSEDFVCRIPTHKIQTQYLKEFPKTSLGAISMWPFKKGLKRKFSEENLVSHMELGIAPEIRNPREQS